MFPPAMSSNGPRKMSQLTWAVGFCMSLYLGPSGCASLRAPRVVEPSVIVIRNSSRVGVNVVTLYAVDKSGNRMRRLGSVSPVPAGVSQIFPRPSSPPPLPAEVEVSWSDTRDGEFSRLVSIETAIRQGDGDGGGALVIDIGPPGAVTAYVEETQRN